MTRFTDKTVIVTGATGALGSSLVRRFAAEGANWRHRRPPRAGRRRPRRGARPRPNPRRPTRCPDEQQWADSVEKAEDAFGPVSVLINNAARIIPGTTETLAPDEFREVVNTNLVGVFLGMRAVVASMRSGGGGSIVNVNSITGLAPAPGLAAYSASKWGIRGLTRTAAAELARDGIRVDGVHPAFIETPLAYYPSGEEILPVGDFAIPRRAKTSTRSAPTSCSSPPTTPPSPPATNSSPTAAHGRRPRAARCHRLTPRSAPRLLGVRTIRHHHQVKIGYVSRRLSNGPISSNLTGLLTVSTLAGGADIAGVTFKASPC